MAVTWNYNGSGTLVATVTGATSGDQYMLECNDDTSSPDTVTASSSTVVLTVTGISAAYHFLATVTHGTPSAVTGNDPPVAVNVFDAAVASTTGVVYAAAWSYDSGTQTVSVTFNADAGATYTLAVDAGVVASLGDFGPETAGLTTLSVVGGTDWTVPTAGRRLYFALSQVDAPGDVLSATVFVSGTSSTGEAGSPATDTDGLIGRLFIAPNDGPLVADPTWVRVDDTDNLVALIQIDYGRSAETEQTDTGQMTVTLNDTEGLFDPANTASSWHGKVNGKQILCRAHNPVLDTWEDQFRGVIDYATFDVNNNTDSEGKPILATVKLECVDMFDQLAATQMAPGLFGDTPPAGMEGIIFYEDTAGTIDDRIIQLLTDAGISSSRTVVFTGNVSAQETKYDAGTSILVGLRDAADAELPMIANIYIDRHGRFVFHGRFSRFDPDTVAADATPGAWDFTRWKAGDGVAIALDADTAQLRVLQFSDGRRDVINQALIWPQDLDPREIPDNVYVDATSEADYGPHALPTYENNLIKAGTTSGNDAKTECAKMGELFVKNMKDPVERPQVVTLKAIDPSDARAAAVWAMLTRADISDIINLNVGYPGTDGVGLQNADHFIEGIHKTIAPLNPDFDYMEVSFDLTPAVWSQDTHGVFTAT